MKNLEWLQNLNFNIGIAWFQNWSFDIGTAFVTLIITPFVIYFVAVLKKHFQAWGAYVVDGIMYQVSNVVNTQLAGRFALKRYAHLRLGEESRYLHVPSSRDIKLEVDQAFVTLSMEHQGGEKRLYDHTDVLSVGSRIRVMGDPGSGKSSLIKRLMRDACFQAISNPKQACLPILLELKTLDLPNITDENGLGIWLFKKLRSNAGSNNVYRMQDCFDSYVQDRGLLVLLDGLDEVSTQQYPRVRDAINQLSTYLAQQNENNKIVLTMRTQFHQQVKDQYRDIFGQALFLRSFSPTDIYEFLTRWPFENNRQTNMARIYKELTDRPSLREMCGNPLVLAMYVAEDQAQSHIVAPDSRTEFYKKVTEELIIKRRQKQTGAALAHTKLREQREQILGKLAYDHMLNADQPANALNWDDAIRITHEVMNCDDQEAEVLFREIARETGLITEERPRETLRFIHLTFCEFLAAFEAVQGQTSGWQILIDTHRSFLQSPQLNLHSRLIEVIPFACGLMQRIGREAALTDIANLDDKALLARSFLETKTYEHIFWPIFVDAQKDALLATPESQWDAEWLRKLHLFNVVIRDANQCATHSTRISTTINLDDFYKILVSKQNASLSTLLSAYASQDAAAAFRLAEVSNLDLATNFPEIILANCDQAPFFALVLEQATREENRVKLWASLLSEAALKSLVVRKQFVREKSLEIWNKYVSTVPITLRWADGSIFRDNLFMQSMTIALLPDASRIPCCTLLDVVANIPPPGAFKKEFFLTGFLAFLLPIFLYLYLFQLEKSVINGAVAMSFVFVSYLCFFRVLFLRIAYRQIFLSFRSTKLPYMETLTSNHLNTDNINNLFSFTREILLHMFPFRIFIGNKLWRKLSIVQSAILADRVL